MGSQAWNPRYLAYCAAHGRGPDEMRAFDRERWRGGTNTGFVLWLNARAQEFTQGVPGRDWADRLRKVDPDAFDEYLRSFAADLTLGLVP